MMAWVEKDLPRNRCLNGQREVVNSVAVHWVEVQEIFSRYWRRLRARESYRIVYQRTLKKSTENRSQTRRALKVGPDCTLTREWRILQVETVTSRFMVLILDGMPRIRDLAIPAISLLALFWIPKIPRHQYPSVICWLSVIGYRLSARLVTNQKKRGCAGHALADC